MFGTFPAGLYIDSTYLLLILPALALSIFAQLYVKRMFSRYSKVDAVRGLTAEQVARTILDRNACGHVVIEQVEGSLTDHFDPRTGVLRLSQGTFGSRSIASVGVAAHEAGHAIQHQQRFLPNRIRGVLVPVAKIGSSFGPYLAIIGLFIAIQPLVDIGIILFMGAVLFYLVTLPVELNASSRAMRQLDENGILDSGELRLARRVLTAAAMTYIASTLVAFASLLRLVLLSRGMRRR